MFSYFASFHYISVHFTLSERLIFAQPVCGPKAGALARVSPSLSATTRCQALSSEQPIEELTWKDWGKPIGDKARGQKRHCIHIYIILYNYIVYNIYIYIYTYILYELHWLSSCIVLDVRLCKIWIECVLKRFEIFSQIKSVFSHCLAMLMIPDPELSRFMPAAAIWRKIPP